MCTVTYVPLKNGCCITSNRDENILREKAIPPTKFIIKDKNIFFPKDPKSGGTWFAHDNKNIIVLLNGAEEKHQSKENYRKSRGLIVIELISSKNPIHEWKKINLKDIEPFTIVLYSNNKLFQLQWNEIEKKQKELDTTNNYIWSSSTLYNKEIRKERSLWFYNLINSENEINADSLINFHKYTKEENKDYGLQINRNNLLKTVSITQCILSNNNITFKYIDLLD